MQYLVYFLISLINLEFIFLNSKSLDFELLSNDVQRFLNIEQFLFQSIYFSLFVSVISTAAYYVLTSRYRPNEKGFNRVSIYFIVNSFVVLISMYFLRIYTASRIFIILSLFIFPLLIYGYTKLNKISKNFSLIVSFVSLLALSFLVVQNLSQETVNTSVEEESNKKDDNRPDDYYPNLDFAYVNDVATVTDFYPNYEEILEEIKDFNSTFIGSRNFENQYILDKYSLCCYWLKYNVAGSKSIGYLEVYKNKLFYINGMGVLSYLETKELLAQNLEFNLIKTNFKNIVNNKFIFERNDFFDEPSNGWESVKDLLIHNDKMYISFVNEIQEDCINIEILVGDVDINNLAEIEFSYFFKNSECILRTEFPLFNAHVSGGKLISLSNNQIGLSTGDFRRWEKAQDDNSYFGKVLSISLNDGSYEIISKGHRNPQGLAVTKNSNFLVETEHGPVGGDEVNLIEIGQNQNFGWPISSYGKHWYEENYELYGDIAPLHNSHTEFGMREPLFYQYVGFFGGIGISDVENNYFVEDDSFFVSTLNGRTIFDISANLENNSMNSFKRYRIEERIRDLEYDDVNNVYYLLLEDSPALGVFYQK